MPTINKPFLLKLVLVVAFNYGARQEIARAAQRMAAAVAAGDLAVGAVTADKLAGYLDAPDLPDPDLIIRLDALPGPVQLAPHLGIDGVHRLGAVEQHHRNVILNADIDAHMMFSGNVTMF